MFSGLLGKDSKDMSHTEISKELGMSLGRVVALLACVVVVFVAQDVLLSGTATFNFVEILFGASPPARINISPIMRCFALLVSVLVGVVFGLFAPRIQFVRGSSIADSGGLTGSQNWVSSRGPMVLAAIGASVMLWVCLQYWYVHGGETARVQWFWFLSLLLFMLGIAGFQSPQIVAADAGRSPQFTVVSMLLLGGVCLLGFLLRFWDIGNLPQTITPDVATVGIMGLENLSERGWRFFGLGFLKSPNMATIPASVSMLLFGKDLAGLRMADVIFGTSMILSTYLMVWRALDSHRLALLASAALTINAPHIHFSRHIFNVDPWAFFGFGCFFLIHALRTRSNSSLGVAGLCVGFALQMYLSSRLLVALIPLFALYLCVFHTRLFWQMRVGWLVFAIGVLVSWGPNCADVVVRFEDWRRSNRLDTTILNPENLAGYARRVGADSMTEVVIARLRENLSIFQINIDDSGQTYFAYPFVDHALAPFVWLGLGLCIVNVLRQPFCALLLFSFLLSVFAHPALSISSQSYWPRSVLLMTVHSVLIAMGLSCFVRAVTSLGMLVLNSLGKGRGRFVWPCYMVEGLFFAVLLGAVGLRSWTNYETAARVDPNPLSFLGRAVAMTKPGIRVCSIPEDAFQVDSWEVRFLAHGRDLRQLTGVVPEDAVTKCGSPTAVWALAGGYHQLREILQQQYPQGEFWDVVDERGRLRLTLFGTQGDPRELEPNSAG
jgi:hypothetical protein